MEAGVIEGLGKAMSMVAPMALADTETSGVL
jgi:hypothetical protein